MLGKVLLSTISWCMGTGVENGMLAATVLLMALVRLISLWLNSTSIRISIGAGKCKIHTQT